MACSPQSPESTCSSFREETASICSNYESAMGRLSTNYESRFGASGGFRQDAPQQSSEQLVTPRSKRPGVTSFTNPKNPFGRVSGKKANPLEEAKVDKGIAGIRTRTAGVMRLETSGPEDVSSAGVHRGAYSFGRECRPMKAGATCPSSGQRSPRGNCSAGVSDALGAGSGSGGYAPATARQMQRSGALGNYLNDMKRSGRTRRSGQAEPSDFTKRLNDRNVMLPAQFANTERLGRAASVDAGSVRRTASEESDRVDVYGFGHIRRQVSERRAGSTTPSFLHHDVSTASTPATTPRQSERQRRAEQRFGEVVDHMGASQTWYKEQRESTKAKIYKSDGFMYSDQVVKHPV